MASLELIRDQGPERSGLIRFTAYWPHQQATWGLKISDAGGESMVGLGPWPFGLSMPLIGDENRLWIPNAELRQIAQMVLCHILPGAERNATDLLLKTTVKR